MGVEGISFHGFINVNLVETYFYAYYEYFTTGIDQFLKTFEQFENFAFIIMSTREFIRLIARASLLELSL